MAGMWMSFSGKRPGGLFAAAIFAAGALAAGKAQAACDYTACARPAFYEVTLERAELCQSAACTSPVIVGEGQKTFDIMSANPGAAIGSFASFPPLAPGRTFTHLRVTLDREMTIRGSVASGGNTYYTPGGDHTCSPANLANNNCGGGNNPNAAAAAPAGESTMIIPDGAFNNSPLTKVDCPTSGTANGCAQTVDPLASPFTVGLRPPRISVAFDTQDALGLFVAPGPTRFVVPADPAPTISIQ